MLRAYYVAVIPHQVYPREISFDTLHTALEATVPLTAALFAADGQLLWLSAQAAERYGLRVVRRWPSLTLAGNLEVLDTFRTVALGALDGPVEVTTPPKRPTPTSSAPTASSGCATAPSSPM